MEAEACFQHEKGKCDILFHEDFFLAILSFSVFSEFWEVLQKNGNCDFLSYKYFFL